MNLNTKIERINNPAHGAWFTKDSEGYDAINDFLGDDESEWEVAGNIFQNPEAI